MSFSTELEFALRTVTASAILVREVGRTMVTGAMSKGDRSPVTVGDFAAQAVAARMLAEEFPADKLVAEENAAELRSPEGADLLREVTRFVVDVFPAADSKAICDWIDLGAAEATGRYWTLDPIDGTKGFLRGDQYAVCLALIDGGEVQLGAIACPEIAVDRSSNSSEKGVLYFAELGHGAWRCSLSDPKDCQRIQVSQRDDASQTRIFRSVEAAHTHGGKVDDLAAALGVTVEPVRMDSQAKYAMLASGQGEALVRLLSPSRPDYREMIWDQAAGMIVVTEAGGRVSDLDGKCLDFRHGRTLAGNRGVVASNGHLHEALLTGLRSIEA